MRHVAWLTICLMSMSPGALAGELYRWLDSKGVMHYSDTPPPKSEQADTMKFSAAGGSEEALSYEARRAQQNFPVTLYVGEACGEPCTQARSLLKKRGIPYSEKLLNTKSQIEEFQKLSGSYDSPTLAVGKTYISGFFESKWNSELDVAGYSKFASYRQKIAPAAPKSSVPETPPVESTSTPAAQ